MDYFYLFILPFTVTHVALILFLLFTNHKIYNLDILECEIGFVSGLI